MRKIVLEKESVKLKVQQLKGVPLKMLVNRGRKKIIRLKGYISECYPSVFIVKAEGLKTSDTLSFSYSDVLCGDIRLFPDVAPEVVNET